MTFTDYSTNVIRKVDHKPTFKLPKQRCSNYSRHEHESYSSFYKTINRGGLSVVYQTIKQIFYFYKQKHEKDALFPARGLWCNEKVLNGRNKQLQLLSFTKKERTSKKGKVRVNLSANNNNLLKKRSLK